MTKKKRRQRGTRTHGGGSQKNRRGAGNRGGRGNAGRSKHEQHGQPPLGKQGFKRPDSQQAEVSEIDLRTLDESAAVWADEGLVEETEDGYRIDVRDVVADGDAADRVKVLGTGEARQPLTVIADAFTESAIEGLEAAGGEARYTDRSQTESDTDNED